MNGSPDDKHTIATYLSDVLALERHMKAPVDAQTASKDHQESGASVLISQIQALNTTHIATLEAALAKAGGSPAAGLKSVLAAVTGTGAAAMTNLRSTKISKSLRDNYTALSLAAISYTMLHATAAGLGDAETAELAKKHLIDYTPLIVDISTAIPGVVLEELKADGENVSVSAAQATQEVSKEAWSGLKA